MLPAMVDLAALDVLPALSMLAVVTLLHELGVPVPMSPAALVVGARAAAGAIDPVLPVAAIVAATLIGNAVWFAAGRRYGLEVLQLAGRLSPSFDKHARRSVDKVDRWGAWLLVIGRFVPGASLVTPPLAGALGMRWSRFLLLTAAGSVLHGAVIVGAGMLLRHEVEAALDTLGRFGGYTLIGLAGALAIYLARRWCRDGTIAPFGERARRLEPMHTATAA
jgi:membrane protein DedA with SNARE-associated domain